MQKKVGLLDHFMLDKEFTGKIKWIVEYDAIGRKVAKQSLVCAWLSVCLTVCRDLPFIPNLERRPYLLMRTKRTRRRTQAKPAKPTAMETWETAKDCVRRTDERIALTL